MAAIASITEGGQYERRPCAGFLLVAVCSLAACYPLESQTGATEPAGPESQARQYEVVSIKPHKSGNNGAAGWRFLPDGFDYLGITLEPLIAYAYDIANDQVSGLPGWVRSSFYDIQARVDEGTAEAWKKLSPQDRSVEQERMVQSLLAGRCQLKAHWETKERPVYDLVIAGGGLKMKEAPPEEKHGGEIREGEVKGHSTSMELLATNLSAWSGEMVVDKTGLSGKRFDFDLTWTPDNRRSREPEIEGPSLFTALKEQLGLKLVHSRAPVQFLVIDHMERPSAN